MFSSQPEEKCQSEVRDHLLVGSLPPLFSVIFFCRAQSGHRFPKQITCPHLSLDSQATAGAGCLPGESLRSDHPANCKCEYRSWWQPGSIAIREADTILLLCFIAGPPAPGASGKWWVARAQALESWASILAPTHAWDCVLGRLIYRG